jgi:hypothetical protein
MQSALAFNPLLSIVLGPHFVNINTFTAIDEIFRQL